MFGSSIMAFIGFNLYGEVDLEIMYILGIGLGLIIFMLKASAMTGGFTIWWLIVFWWLGFQGIIKPKFASSPEFIYILNESFLLGIVEVWEVSRL